MAKKVIGGCQALVDAGILDEEGNVVGVAGGGGGFAMLQSATTAKSGIVKQMEAIPDISGEPTKSDFNNLLAKMRSAGILASG